MTTGNANRESCILADYNEAIDDVHVSLHASDQSARQALELFSGPILASHQNCRALVPGERQFPDDLLKAVIQRGGVIGASMDTWMLYKPGIDWGGKIPPRRSVFPREEITLNDLADHIDYVCQLSGNALHAGIGGDTDGQGGCEGAPLEIDTVADYQKLADVLEVHAGTIEITNTLTPIGVAMQPRGGFDPYKD